MKCEYCKNYNEIEDNCKYCQYEYNKEFNPYKKDDWDILNLDENEWSHIQIRNRLYFEDIECLFVDIWSDGNIAWMIGCNTTSHKIAQALNINEEVVYNDSEHGFIILNLYQEKQIRKKNI